MAAESKTTEHPIIQMHLELVRAVFELPIGTVPPPTSKTTVTLIFKLLGHAAGHVERGSYPLLIDWLGKLAIPYLNACRQCVSDENTDAHRALHQCETMYWETRDKAILWCRAPSTDRQ